MRDDFERKYITDKTYPVTKGNFLQIVSEASYEEYKADAHENNITPFWRVVKLNIKLAAKIVRGIDSIARTQTRREC